MNTTIQNNLEQQIRKPTFDAEWVSYNYDIICIEVPIKKEVQN